MDNYTPVVALVGVATFFVYAVVGSSVIEIWTGRRVRLLAVLGLAQLPKDSARWKLLVVSLGIGVPVGIIQVAMISALIGPDRAPLTRVMGGLEIAGLGIWAIGMIRLIRGVRRDGT